MAITDLATYDLVAYKQRIDFFKSGGILGGGVSAYTSNWKNGTLPAAGVDPGNTANGLVPTDATTGAPDIAFSSGVGYLTSAELMVYANQVIEAQPMAIALCDRLFHVGAFAGTSGITTLTSQPSFAGRVPNTDYSGLILFYEQAVQGNATPNTFTVTYTNENGVAGKVTPSFAATIYALPVLYRIPLAAGDRGIQKIESVNTGGGTTTFNLVIARLLWSGCGTEQPGDLQVFGMEKTGMPRVYPDSCLWTYFQRGINDNPVHALSVEIASN